MKKFLLLYILAGIIIITGLFLFMQVDNFHYEQELDMIAINKIVKGAEEHWDDLKQMDIGLFSYDFSIISNDGVLLLSTSETVPADIYEAVKTRQTVMDITVHEETVGKAVIATYQTDFLAKGKRDLSFFILFSYLLLALLLLIYFLYLYKKLIHPFQMLTFFAKNITDGNFDAPLPMDQKNIFGAFTESFDVMREALADARRKEQIASQSKKELAASLSHDIKTPTTSIKIITELLLVTVKDETLRNKLDTIYAKADQIDQLSSNMLQAALEESGELNVNIADEQSLVLYDLFKNTEFREQIAVESIPPCMIRIDISRLQQVINNIVKNSYKYANTKIHVHFRLGPDYLRVSIDDFGPGVKEDEMDFIFQKYYRGTNATMGKKEGEGLGLFIAKSLMNKMDGDIECANRQDGFTVKLWIPLS